MDRNRLVRHLTSEVLASIAPEELVIAESYDPKGSDYGSTSRGPQGFGVEAAITLALPLVYKFFDKFVERLATNTADEISTTAKQWFANRTQTAEEEKIRGLIQAELTKLGMTPDSTSAAASAIIATLQRNAGSVMKGA